MEDERGRTPDQSPVTHVPVTGSSLLRPPINDPFLSVRQ